MLPPFHVFRVQGDGSLRWVEAAEDVDRAKALAKSLAASAPGEYVITNMSGEKISVKFPPKRILFQIGYDEKELNARAELFRRVGHEVISVPDNETAKNTLASMHNVDVFVVGHTAPEQTRKEMVAWLKERFPNVKIVALIPAANRQMPQADFNIVLNDSEEFLALLSAAAS